MNVDGPYIQNACICTDVRIEADGLRSLIRIVDRLLVKTFGPVKPAVLPPFKAHYHLIVMLFAGERRGKYGLRVTLEAPDERMVVLKADPVEFREGQTVGIDHEFDFISQLPGTYWFKIFLDKKFLSAVPFDVVHRHEITDQ